MFERLFSLDYRRKKRLKRAPEGVMRDYLATPLPDVKQDCREVEYLALDLETTGLDAGRDAILSFGYVVLHGTRIDLGSAAHRIVKVQQAIPEASAVIHQITDDRTATGEPLESVMADVLEVMAGRVLIAHHAHVELGFIGAACERLYGVRPVIPVVDTQWIARRTMERRNESFKPGELRLFNLRTRYNLPRYRAHDALSDALAAAELFAAQVAERRGEVPLKGLLLPQ